MPEIRYIVYPSPLGTITLAAQDEGLTGLWFPTQQAGREMLFSARRCDGDPVLRAAAAWLERYFSGGRPAPQELLLAPQGSAFRQQVWRLLCEIPYGAVVTYGEIAQEIALRSGREKMAAQAVGGAVGHNPISLIIPCHRVIAAGGRLGGYGGGLELKRRLLAWEGVSLPALAGSE